MPTISTSISSLGLLDFAISAADDTMTWGIIISSKEISMDNVTSYNVADGTPYVSARYGDGTPVEWRDNSPASNTDLITVTALRDSVVFVLTGQGLPGFTINPYIFKPYYLDISETGIYNSTVSATLSSHYRQAQTNAVTAIPANSEVTWINNPILYSIKFGLSGEENQYDNNDLNGTLQGTSPSASKASYFYTGTLYDQTVAITTIVSNKYTNSPFSDNFQLTQPTFYKSFNPSINIKFDDTKDTKSIILCAVQSDELVDGTTKLRWNTNYTGVCALTGALLNSKYNFNTQGNASQIGIVKASAVDLTKLYTISLSSYTPTVSTTFRPYLTTGFDNISARITRLPDGNESYFYNFKALGITSNTLHNLSPNQYIRWNSDKNEITTSEPNNPEIDSYNIGQTGTARNIDDITVEIKPAVVRNLPRLSTINFTLSTLNSALLSDGGIDSYNFTLRFAEWVDPSYLDPKFKFQYEPDDQNTIYRPITSAIYKIENTSVLPPDSHGTIQFTFNNAICSVKFDKRTEPFILPAPVYHQFNSTSFTYIVCTISMKIFLLDDSNSPTAEIAGPTKNIIFTTFPVASNFICYPEFRWDRATQSWKTVVKSKQNNTGIIELGEGTAILSAYGLCHTENFFVSGLPEAGNLLYTWNIQPVNEYNNTNTSIFNVNTGWVPVKTGVDTKQYSICASILTPLISNNPSPFYYDSLIPKIFPNYYTTFLGSTAFNRKHIDILGAQSLGTIPLISSVEYKQMPVGDNNQLYILGKYNTETQGSPFSVYIPAFYFILSSEFWQQTLSVPADSNKAEIYVNVEVDDIGDSYIGVPKNEVTRISITPGVTYTIDVNTNHPSANDWCNSNNITYNYNSVSTISAYPILPLIYNPNRFIITGQSISFENLVNCFSSIDTEILQFEWQDRNNSFITDTCNSYITSFNQEGTYSISLATSYKQKANNKTIQNSFPDVVNVQKEYIQYDPDLTRVFGGGKLKLPYDRLQCSMPPNEWVTEDTFNSVMIKLYDNLTFLDNNSRLYNAPPTDYVGWFGSLYYNNSAARTRWFTKTPENTYKYDDPSQAINYTFNNIQSCYVKNNIMYISNGQSISILSNDFNGSLISKRNYKTIGDDFSCIRTVDLDSENRIYLLDSYDPNNTQLGSRNRILVFNFNFVTNEWALLYEWGGLGGPGANNKFNNPNDLHIDKDDTIWVADTNNRCIKRYTRTGSWLYTFKSPYFSDEQKPMSVVVQDEYIFVLTTSKIVKFDKEYNFLDIYDTFSGGLKISTCKDGGFMYVTYPDKIAKIMVTGSLAGLIAVNDFSNYKKDYRDAYHDEYRNLYIINNNHILKYVDLLFIIPTKPSTVDKMWPLESLLVEKDEYIQDWVINRCVQRFWDNLEIFRRSLVGKFAYATITSTTTSNVVSTSNPPDNFDYCNYDWLYQYNRIVQDVIITSYNKPTVRTFTPFEYKTLPYEKNTVYLGINELNGSDVYNRVFGKLFECEEVLLEMISD